MRVVPKPPRVRKTIYHSSFIIETVNYKILHVSIANRLSLKSGGSEPEENVLPILDKPTIWFFESIL